MYVCQLYPAIIKIQLKAKKFNQSVFFTISFMPVTSYRNLYFDIKISIFKPVILSIIFSNLELDSTRPYKYDVV